MRGEEARGLGRASGSEGYGASGWVAGVLLGLSAAGSWVSASRGYRQRYLIHESSGAPTATGLDSDSHFDSNPSWTAADRVPSI